MSIPAADGKTAFLEDAYHPVLKGLQDKSFSPGRAITGCTAMPM